MAIIQQEFQHDPWKMLVGCIMLNQTSNKNVRQVIYSFFDKWPTPHHVINADEDEIREHIRPLGFYNRRTTTIMRFSHEYIVKISGDYIKDNGITEDTQVLLDEITSLRQQVLDTQTIINDLTKQ